MSSMAPSTVEAAELTLKEPMFIFGALQCMSFILLAFPHFEFTYTALINGCTVPIGRWLLIYGTSLLLSGLTKIGLIYMGRKKR